jgi:hypothetical protein
LGHSWSWIPDIARESMAAYAKETSVYAFNFAALVAGLRRANTITAAGIRYVPLAWILPAAVCVIAGYALWREGSEESLVRACCLALLGFFVFAPTAYPHQICSAIAFASVPAAEKRRNAGALDAPYWDWIVQPRIHEAYGRQRFAAEYPRRAGNGLWGAQYGRVRNRDA